MIGGRLWRPALATIVASLLLVPAVRADTCCANLPVQLDPPAAEPGETVRLGGLQCQRGDGSGPLSLNLGAFWLATGRRPAEDPRDIPGNLPYPDLPPLERWFPFQSVPPFDTTTRGDAAIVVPDLPDGRYQLWWWCDNGGGPGAGIHYSTGRMLAIGVAPDTATAAPGVLDARAVTRVPAWFWVALGVSAFLGVLWLLSPGRSGQDRHRAGHRSPHRRGDAPRRPA